MAAIAAVFFALLAASRSHYSLSILSSGRKQYHVIGQCWVFAVLAIGWIAFLTKSTDAFSRGAITSGCILALVLLASVRAFYIPILARQLNNGRLAVRRAFVVQVGRDGRYDLNDDFIAGGIKIAGRSVVSDDRLGGRRLDEVFGEIVREATSALARMEFDAIYLFFPWQKGAELKRLRSHMRAIPKPVYLFEDPCFAHLMTGSHLDIGSARAYEI